MYYIYTFLEIYQELSLLKQTFISKITVELSKNISPEPSERNSLEILLENYNKLFNDENDWSFVKKIRVKKDDKII